MLKQLTFAILATLFLPGCGFITTELSVLKPEYLDGIRMEAKQYQELRTAFEQDEAYLEKRFAQDFEKLDELYERVAVDLDRKAGALTAEGKDGSTLRHAATVWRSEVKAGEFRQLIRQKIHEIGILNAQIRTELPKEPNYVSVLRGDAPIPGTVITLLNNRRASYRDLESMIAGQKNSMLAQIRSLSTNSASGNQPARTADIQKSEKQIAEHHDSMQQKTLLALAGWKAIHDDRNSYYVASAKEEVWATRYNKVNAFGMFGNSDFIIVMDERGNFRMKGISFDPSKVAEMASKVTTQALIAAVSIAGVPVPKGSSDNSDSGEKQALGNSNDALLAKQHALNTTENQYINYRSALIDIAKSIVEKKDDLNDKGRYAAATKAIKETFNAHKARLTMAQ